MDSIKAIPVNEKFEHYEHFEQIMRYLWAAQLGFWVENKTYYDRSEPEGDHVVASSVTDNAGFTFFRLNKSLEFYMLMKEPKDGFASYFKVTDDLTNFFAFLGTTGVMGFSSLETASFAASASLLFFSSKSL